MATITEIQQLIDKEISPEKNIRNVFGLDLTKCLIEPRKEEYLDGSNTERCEMLWTVFEESRGSGGYTIYFDEETGLFGRGNEIK